MHDADDTDDVEYGEWPDDCAEQIEDFVRALQEKDKPQALVLMNNMLRDMSSNLILKLEDL